MSTWTGAEVEAHRLLIAAGVAPRQNFGAGFDIHGSADRIIELAERIKAERAVMAMEGSRG